MRKRYNTPHRSRVVKTRMTEEEYAEFAQRLSAYNMSQAEFIRQAIIGAAIRPIGIIQGMLTQSCFHVGFHCQTKDTGIKAVKDS